MKNLARKGPEIRMAAIFAPYPEYAPAGMDLQVRRMVD